MAGSHEISLASDGITVDPVPADDSAVIEARCTCGNWSAQFRDPVRLWDVLKAVGQHVLDPDTDPFPQEATYDQH